MLFGFAWQSQGWHWVLGSLQDVHGALLLVTLIKKTEINVSHLMIVEVYYHTFVLRAVSPSAVGEIICICKF